MTGNVASGDSNLYIPPIIEFNLTNVIEFIPISLGTDKSFNRILPKTNRKLVNQSVFSTLNPCFSFHLKQCIFYIKLTNHNMQNKIELYFSHFLRIEPNSFTGIFKTMLNLSPPWFLWISQTFLNFSFYLCCEMCVKTRQAMLLWIFYAFFWSDPRWYKIQLIL